MLGGAVVGVKAKTKMQQYNGNSQQILHDLCVYALLYLFMLVVQGLKVLPV